MIRFKGSSVCREGTTVIVFYEIHTKLYIIPLPSTMQTSSSGKHSTLGEWLAGMHRFIASRLPCRQDQTCKDPTCQPITMTISLATLMGSSSATTRRQRCTLQAWFDAVERMG